MNFNERIVMLCKSKNISQSELERALDIAKGSVTKWKIQEPKYSTVEKIAKYFNVSMDYLMTGEEKENGEVYYINDEARDMAEFMFKNPDYKVLFDASRKVKKEDILFVKEMLDRFKDE